MPKSSVIQEFIDAVEALGGTRQDVMEVLKHPSSVKKIAETLLEERDELKRTISFILPDTFSLDGFENMSLYDDSERHNCKKLVSISLDREDLPFYFDVKIIKDLFKNINPYSCAGARAFDFLCSHEYMISVDLRRFTWIFPGTLFVCSCGRIAMRAFYFDKTPRQIIVHDDDQLNTVWPLHRIAIFTNVVKY